METVFHTGGPLDPSPTNVRAGSLWMNTRKCRLDIQVLDPKRRMDEDLGDYRLGLTGWFEIGFLFSIYPPN